MGARFGIALIVAAIVFSAGHSGAFASDSGQSPTGATPENAGPLLEESQWNEDLRGPLPRWREDGTPQPDVNQSLQPFAISRPGPHQAPTSGLIESPPEYAPCDGVIFRYSSGAWPIVVRDLVVGLTADPAHDEIAYVVVANSSQQTSATNLFTAGGADMSKVQFILMPNDSIWLRDYGPHFIWQGGARAIVDSHYYPTRPLDNFIPTLLADDYFVVPSYDIGLYYSGGNFQPDAARRGYMTSLVNLDNPGFGEAFVGELLDTYQGIDVFHLMPQLPFSVDGTGHIDMWFYLVDEDTVIISEFLPGSNATAISITNNAVPYMEALGYEVFRVPDHNGFHPQGTSHFTYTNAFRVNDRIFIPTYGQGDAAHLARDAQALATWAAAAPDAEIVPINSYDIIPAAGAIHCIVMQVPRYTDSGPAAHVVDPSGGELLVWNKSYEVKWTASDDVAVTSVDLHCSTDGGATFPHVISTGEANDGRYKWAVDELATNDAIVRVTAHDVDTNTAEGLSETSFSITCLPQTVYDFLSGGGVNKWGWGSASGGWSDLNAQRLPGVVADEISALVFGAYTKIGKSDASGSDADSNRYIAPNPSGTSNCCFNNGTPGCDDPTCQAAVCACDPFCCGTGGGFWDEFCAGGGFQGSGCGAAILCSNICMGQQFSTHVFEFEIDEAASSIRDIGIVWEGYGDDALQMELYVWDENQGNWGDGAGKTGENRFMDNFAGNRDAKLGGHVRSDFDHYLTPSGVLTILLYAERSSQESFHDYVAITVTRNGNGDVNDSGVADFDDVADFVGVLLGTNTDPFHVCRSDLDGNGTADGADVKFMAAALLGA